MSMCKSELYNFGGNFLGVATWFPINISYYWEGSTWGNIQEGMMPKLRKDISPHCQTSNGFIM